ncbi:hypothetical protein PAUR_a3511 [Pseudoalteromonas aurantia 208]|uniref:Uncharacterized protein n=1 Tax=Pseudoalteromonas aurantia 208 TaxID=1314867 RepID=A0ABR9E686_9GAMM|nr:hypothetical protein [Pseudoalteromonas aurantia 208]
MEFICKSFALRIKLTLKMFAGIVANNEEVGRRVTKLSS